MKICVILFKNWKLMFKIMYQIGLNILNNPSF